MGAFSYVECAECIDNSYFNRKKLIKKIKTTIIILD